MKIRTDFVTNSSSSNYVTICIKNPKLTEIIRAARVCKETGESDTDKVYHYDRLDIDESEQIVKINLEITDILNTLYGFSEEAIEHYGDLEDLRDSAVSNDFPDIGFPPEHLSGLSESLIRLLKAANNYLSLNKDFEKICSALEQNGEDIIADTESADWTYDGEGHGEAALFSWFSSFSALIVEGAHLDRPPSSVGVLSSFHYDKENGESLKEEFSYWEPNRETFTDDDLNDEIDSMEYGFTEGDWDDEDDWDLKLNEDDFTEEDKRSDV